ncbi:MAG: tryptophan--tRNA ligase [Candidatus Melainabacteria bacterium]|nr:tryptophan--tRNA ligase [Candidatus Melainabacteria bacterium]
MFVSENKLTILTGDRPTGPLHLGHYLGSLQNRVILQNQGEYQQYILIADTQALTDHFSEPLKVQENILEVTMDYLAVGIDPNLSTICVQSLLTALPEITMYFLNLLTLNQIERNPTVKEEIKQKDFGNKIPVGFLIYPVSQAADITAFLADLVPVGADQIPMIEDTNFIVRKFNDMYGAGTLKECKAKVPEQFSRLIGIDGKAKMSKSLGNCIYLKSTSDELWTQVKQMYTDPNHIRVEDPGQIEGNVVFTYLDAFDENKQEVASLKDQYRQGGLGDMKIKKYLFEVLDNKFKGIRERRLELASDKAQIIKILKEGTLKANEVSQATLSKMKRAMKMFEFV